MTDLFDWKITLGDVGTYRGSHRATPEERKELAKALGISACDSLNVTFEVHPLSAGMYRLNGHIQADVVQPCVVTLEPVPQRIDEPINIELRPAKLMPEAPEGEQEILSTADIEPIENDTIDLGLLVLEHISTGLDPYPRKPDAELSYSDEAEGRSANAFAVLAKLKEASRNKD